jgi:hypothetical protein
MGTPQVTSVMDWGTCMGRQRRRTSICAGAGVLPVLCVAIVLLHLAAGARAFQACPPARSSLAPPLAVCRGLGGVSGGGAMRRLGATVRLGAEPSDGDGAVTRAEEGGGLPSPLVLARFALVWQAIASAPMPCFLHIRIGDT